MWVYGSSQLRCPRRPLVRANVAADTMQIRVVLQADNRVYLVEVDRHSTVRELKLALRNTKGIEQPTYHQHLVFNNNTVGSSHSTVSFPPQEELPLTHYGIIDGSTLQLSTACGCSFFAIFVEAADRRIIDIISLRVSFSDTVRSIKRLIDEKTGIPVGQQHLSFEGSLLEDHVQLHECDVNSYSTLDLRVAQEN